MTLLLDDAAPDMAALDEDFLLDLTVVESFTGIPFAMCKTSDGCGTTCSNGASACNSAANDPF